MIYDYFRVTGAHDTVLDYADLFSVTLRNYNVQEVDTRCFEIFIINDEDSIGSYSGQFVLKTVLELHDMEIHQKISMPNYQRFKTMVKRRKGQKLRLRNFDNRH